MNILFFGAGAVGQGIGGMLAAHGCGVDMVLRKHYRDAIKYGGLHITGIYGDHNAEFGKLGLAESVEAFAGNDYDYILLTTKSFDTDTALEEIDRHITSGNIVSVQNGCGNLEKVILRFGQSRSLAARVITGFEIVNPGVVRITVSADAVHIGGPVEGIVDGRAVKLAELIDGAGLPCSATPFIRRDLFAKLLYNCALNPLGAILGVHYGALGDSVNTRKVMDAVIDEVFEMLDDMGEQTHWENAESFRDSFYNVQIPATYNHRSSMLQDIEKGKKTEIDALTGYVSLRANKAGFKTPVCDTLSSIIGFMETRSIDTSRAGHLY
jgi:2-dehydropantoate 2-reductase